MVAGLTEEIICWYNAEWITIWNEWKAALGTKIEYGLRGWSYCLNYCTFALFPYYIIVIDDKDTILASCAFHDERQAVV